MKQNRESWRYKVPTTLCMSMPRKWPPSMVAKHTKPFCCKESPTHQTAKTQLTKIIHAKLLKNWLVDGAPIWIELLSQNPCATVPKQNDCSIPKTSKHRNPFAFPAKTSIENHILMADLAHGREREINFLSIDVFQNHSATESPCTALWVPEIDREVTCGAQFFG